MSQRFARRAPVLTFLVALLCAAVACGGEIGDNNPDGGEDGLKPSTTEVSYEGPQDPGGSGWILRSLDGMDVSEDFPLFLTLGKQEMSVEGECVFFSRRHELDQDRLRTVGADRATTFDCGDLDSAAADAVLSIVRDLEAVRVGEGTLELRAGSGETAVFVPPPPARVDTTLAGTEWILTALNGREPLRDEVWTLEIGKDQMVGYGPCNGFGGGVSRVSRGDVEWSPNPNEGFAGTLVGCGGEAGKQEVEFERALQAAESYSLNGDLLELRNGAGETTLAFAQEAQWSSDPEKLVGTAWVLRSLGGVEPEKGSVPTVRFVSDKEVAWYDGCQNFEGKYVASENDLEAPSFRVVGGDCMKPEALENPGEPCISGCFAPAGDYRLRDGLLEIRSESGKTTSILEPLEGKEPKQKGTSWELRSFVEDGESTSVSGGTRITLTFDRGTLREAGTMFGFTGCNNYRIDYEHPVARNGPDRLIMGDPSVTRGICPKASGAVEQEERFLGTLVDVGYYPAIFPDGRMTLDTEDGRKLVFRAPG